MLAVCRSERRERGKSRVVRSVLIGDRAAARVQAGNPTCPRSTPPRLDLTSVRIHRPPPTPPRMVAPTLTGQQTAQLLVQKVSRAFYNPRQSIVLDNLIQKPV